MRMAYTLTDSGNSGKARCEIGWNWRPAPLADYDLWCVLSGSGKMVLGGRTYPLRPGACFVLHPGDQPAAEQDAEDRLTVVYIHFGLIPLPGCAAEPKGDLLPERVVYVEERGELERLLHQALGIRFRQDAWTEQEFDGVLKQILIRLYRCREEPEPASALSRKQRQAVARVLHRLHEEAGRRLPHEELAELVGLTPAYLNRLFKKATGSPLKENVTRIRLQRAKHLLSETTMNVSQVADALGYASVFLFSKQFKKHYGVPPSAYLLETDPPKPHG
ncbi:AraC family transcriptional regulator [Paenibacillus filicis]|uniref:AraC family transcriptional regulator n=1 Tax=Paenibacillus gyeongsangnamensis TaxID=3388067 RepID=A0ABT4QKR6_9BACL|nr:AraC family transcriptional regulator [Paenibacillus filicis]MCZ8517402.1 AraC family transcriptional regulator [Paenibacillus filicis]